MSDESTFTEGSGNVYADLGLPNPEERKAKADLAYRIGKTIDARRLTQPEVAALLDLLPEEVSSLQRGRLSIFTVERLLHFLTVLGHDVRIEVLPLSDAFVQVEALRAAPHRPAIEVLPLSDAFVQGYITITE